MKKNIAWVGSLLIFLIMTPVYAASVTVSNHTPYSIIIILSGPNFGLQDTILPNSSKIEAISISSGSITYAAAFVSNNNTPSCQGTMMVNQTLSMYSNSSNTLNCQV